MSTVEVTRTVPRFMVCAAVACVDCSAMVRVAHHWDVSDSGKLGDGFADLAAAGWTLDSFGCNICPSCSQKKLQPFLV